MMERARSPRAGFVTPLPGGFGHRPAGTMTYFVIAGLDPAIHAASPLPQSHRLQMRRVSMDHRVKPGGDELGDASRERLVIASGTKCSEAIQSEVLPWIASSLSLLAMTISRTWCSAKAPSRASATRYGGAPQIRDRFKGR